VTHLLRHSVASAFTLCVSFVLLLSLGVHFALFLCCTVDYVVGLWSCFYYASSVCYIVLPSGVIKNDDDDDDDDIPCYVLSSTDTAPQERNTTTITVTSESGGRFLN